MVIRNFRSRLMLLAIGLPLSVCVLLTFPGAFQKTRSEGRFGPRHEFHLDASPPFLSDALAVEKARETLALESCDPSAWRPHEYRQTTAPDGTQDVYLFRDANYPNTGLVEFENVSGAAIDTIRSIQIELVGNRLTGQVVFPKR